jgi:hypothetical protein
MASWIEIVMDTRRLPPALLIALGLIACGDDGTEVSTSACLSFTGEPATETGSSGSGSDSGSDSGSETSDGTGTTFGPCLDVEPPTSTTTGGTGSGSDDSTTVGPCLVPEPPTSTGESDSSGTTTDSGGAADRDELVQTLIGRGVLPDDVAAKLRGG